MGLLHVLGKLVRLDLTYAIVVDVLDPDLVAALYVEVHADGAADDGILLNIHVHIHLEETLFLIITLDDIYGRSLDIVRELAARAEVQALLKVFLLSGLYAGVRPSGYPGALFDNYLEPRSVTCGVLLIYYYGYVLEIALGYKALNDSGNILSRYSNAHAGTKTGELQDLILGEILVPFYAYTAHNVFAGMQVIYLNGTAVTLSHCPKRGKCQKCCADYPSYFHSL